MEKTDFIKRLEDLSERCERTSSITFTAFLTPAEQYALEQWAPHLLVKPVLSGGGCDNERKVAFFLPFYIDNSEFCKDEYINAIKIRSFFGTPEHRDYMGAILGLGIKREWLGDIIVDDNICYVYCLKSVTRLLLTELEKVGSCSVKTNLCLLSDVPIIKKDYKTITFTVKSLRLDAVAGDLFHISRSQAADAVREGLVSLNYSICDKVDAEVKENDIISIRGKGKGRISNVGGKSKKDRLFISAELYK